MNYQINPIISQFRLPLRSWFKSKAVKAGLVIIGVISVILIVLFNQQIGNLFKFFGSKAALDTGSFTLQGDSALPGYFLSSGYTAEELLDGNWIANDTAVTIDNQNNNLILNIQ